MRVFFNRPIIKLCASVILAAFSYTSVISPNLARAQMISTQTVLPLPAVLSGTGTVQPITLKGLNIHPDNALRFDFIIDDAGRDLPSVQYNAESLKLIKYFLAALTIPEEDMWVNLSPNEPDRIVPQAFGTTEMGRDLLAQDYLLKQMTAALLSPEMETGAAFWERIHAQVGAYGNTPLQNGDILMNILSKIWIVPESAQVYEHARGAFVVDARLEVMVESDYMAKCGDQCSVISDQSTDHRPLTTELLRDTLIPAIEREVNHGAAFANLRQVYNAVILAGWYKRALKKSLLGRIYVDQHMTQGVDHVDPAAVDAIYQNYLQAFRDGTYDMIKEEYDPVAQEVVVRHYFTGGASFAMTPNSTKVSAFNPALDAARATRGDVFTVELQSDAAMGKKPKNKGNQAGVKKNKIAHIRNITSYFKLKEISFDGKDLEVKKAMKKRLKILRKQLEAKIRRERDSRKLAAWLEQNKFEEFSPLIQERLSELRSITDRDLKEFRTTLEKNLERKLNDPAMAPQVENKNMMIISSRWVTAGLMIATISAILSIFDQQQLPTARADDLNSWLEGRHRVDPEDNEVFLPESHVSGETIENLMEHLNARAAAALERGYITHDQYIKWLLRINAPGSYRDKVSLEGRLEDVFPASERIFPDTGYNPEQTSFIDPVEYPHEDLVWRLHLRAAEALDRGLLNEREFIKFLLEINQNEQEQIELFYLELKLEAKFPADEQKVRIPDAAMTARDENGARTPLSVSGLMIMLALAWGAILSSDKSFDNQLPGEINAGDERAVDPRDSSSDSPPTVSPPSRPRPSLQQDNKTDTVKDIKQSMKERAALALQRKYITPNQYDNWFGRIDRVGSKEDASNLATLLEGVFPPHEQLPISSEEAGKISGITAILFGLVAEGIRRGVISDDQAGEWFQRINAPGRFKDKEDLRKALEGLLEPPDGPKPNDTIEIFPPKEPERGYVSVGFQGGGEGDAASSAAMTEAFIVISDLINMPGMDARKKQVLNALSGYDTDALYRAAMLLIRSGITDDAFQELTHEHPVFGPYGWSEGLVFQDMHPMTSASGIEKYRFHQPVGYMASPAYPFQAWLTSQNLGPDQSGRILELVNRALGKSDFFRSVTDQSFWRHMRSFIHLTALGHITIDDLNPKPGVKWENGRKRLDVSSVEGIETVGQAARYLGILANELAAANNLDEDSSVRGLSLRVPSKVKRVSLDVNPINLDSEKHFHSVPLTFDEPLILNVRKDGSEYTFRVRIKAGEDHSGAISFTDLSGGETQEEVRYTETLTETSGVKLSRINNGVHDLRISILGIEPVTIKEIEEHPLRRGETARFILQFFDFHKVIYAAADSNGDVRVFAHPTDQGVGQFKIHTPYGGPIVVRAHEGSVRLSVEGEMRYVGERKPGVEDRLNVIVDPMEPVRDLVISHILKPYNERIDQEEDARYATRYHNAARFAVLPGDSNHFVIRKNGKEVGEFSVTHSDHPKMMFQAHLNGRKNAKFLFNATQSRKISFGGPKNPMIIKLRASRAEGHENWIDVFNMNPKGDIEIIKSGYKREKVFANAAMNASIPQTLSPKQNPGGIDLNAAMINMDVRREGEGLQVPLVPRDFDLENFNGFVPVIINIRPIVNLPLLLGMLDDDLPVENPDTIPSEFGRELEPADKREVLEQALL